MESLFPPSSGPSIVLDNIARSQGGATYELQLFIRASLNARPTPQYSMTLGHRLDGVLLSTDPWLRPPYQLQVRFVLHLHVGLTFASCAFDRAIRLIVDKNCNKAV